MPEAENSTEAEIGTEAENSAEAENRAEAENSAANSVPCTILYSQPHKDGLTNRIDPYVYTGFMCPG